MKKVLAIFMAIAMVATMFSFSVVAFAEGEEETPVKEQSIYYIGGISASTTSIKAHGSTGRTEGRAIKLECFDDSTNYSKRVLPAIEEEIESGEYSAIVLRVAGDSPVAIRFAGLKGTEETPIIITCKPDAPAIPLIDSNNAEAVAPAITIENCENITVEKIAAKTSISNGVVVKNCKNVTLKELELKNVGYTDYTLPASTDAETGVETFPEMETADILAKGSAILVGAGNENVTIDSCKFENCRAGVVVDNTIIEDEAEAAEEAAPAATTGVEVLNCTFDKINEAAVIVNGAEDVLVSGGSATGVGNLANAEDYDGTAVAVVKLNGAKNATVERIFSSYNEAFVNAEASTGRIRYNVSDGDKSSTVSGDILVYNNTFVNASGLNLNATVKNNIFSMLIGEKVAVGAGEANCYHWTSKGDRKSIKKNPQFANAYDGSIEGTSARDNYILSSKSPCLGEGVQVEDDMGSTDFYGNAIGSSHNIGADEGAGAEATVKLVSQFVDGFNYIIALIRNFFANLFG